MADVLYSTNVSETHCSLHFETDDYANFRHVEDAARACMDGVLETYTYDWTTYAIWNRCDKVEPPYFHDVLVYDPYSGSWIFEVAHTCPVELNTNESATYTVTSSTSSTYYATSKPHSKTRWTHEFKNPSKAYWCELPDPPAAEGRNNDDN